MQMGRRQLRDESGGKDPWLPIGVGLFKVSWLLSKIISVLKSGEIQREGCITLLQGELGAPPTVDQPC